MKNRIRKMPFPLLCLSLGLVLHDVTNSRASASDSLADSELSAEPTTANTMDDGPAFEMEEEVDKLVQDDTETVEKPGLLRWTEYRYGQRLDASAHNERSHMHELRAQFAYQQGGDSGKFSTRFDVLLDEALQEQRLDLREFKYNAKLSDNLSMTLGRQTITWLVGDNLPVNDFFPKDFNAYYMGRDAEREYMKSPSDAIQLNYSTDIGQFDLVYAPSFEANRYPQGERFSYFSPFTQAVEGAANPMPRRVDDEAFTHDAWYLRYARQLGANEVFVFLHDGYWMEASSIDVASNELYHAPLRSYGGAWRGPMLGGLATLEAAYYDSTDDSAGDNPLIPNDQLRGLVQYDRELAKNLNLTTQYYIEHRMDQDAYERSLPAGTVPKPENYEQVTLRLSKTFLQQTLGVSGLTYYSPTEEDSYFRLNVRYQPDDHWQYHAGVNIFDGESNDTRWGQYQDNSNVFVGIRYNW